MQNNILKMAYLQRPMYQVENFKKEIIKNCHWSPTQWFHKLHGRTALSPLEVIEINKVITRFSEAERHDIKITSND